ncbi:MAG: type III pantothenate kinase [Planctomycetota bacterium]|jgi:type III pantothenate kinase
MNIIAVDIGNTNITIGLFLNDSEEFIKSVPGESEKKLTELLSDSWSRIPIAKSSREKKRDGVIVVSSVRPDWTGRLEEIARKQLDERIYLIGKDIPLPIRLWVDEPEKLGTDRALSAAAAYAVVENAVVVADFGTAVTIDLVDESGIFQGGVICPGFEISAQALKDNAAQLQKVKVSRPREPYGKNTTDAINCGLYYSAVATLQEVIRRYAEKIGTWPHTIITGSAAAIIKDDCQFVDSYVPYLVVKGIVLAYRKFIEEKME